MCLLGESPAGPAIYHLRKAQILLFFAAFVCGLALLGVAFMVGMRCILPLLEYILQRNAQVARAAVLERQVAFYKAHADKDWQLVMLAVSSEAW